ncbi:MAG: hypothetical protein ACQSGP_01545 [Frankia sp.]
MIADLGAGVVRIARVDDVDIGGPETATERTLRGAASAAGATGATGATGQAADHRAAHRPAADHQPEGAT